MTDKRRTQIIQSDKARIKVEGHDNRIGVDGGDVGFGYVYFNDGSRMGWDTDRGAWHCNTPWGHTDDRHVEAAFRYLITEKLINMDKVMTNLKAEEDNDNE